MEITLPERIGHGYIKPILLNIEDIYKEPLRSHRRLRVFAEKGLKCEYCSRMGIYLIKAEKPVKISKTKPKEKIVVTEYHIDIYTADFKLMTIDHIVPKCKGGGNNISNLIPSCAECNEEKGGKDYFTFVNKWKKQVEMAYGLILCNYPSNKDKSWNQNGGRL